ncbi:MULTISPECIES: hypothetical protein [Mesonia]|uniref:Uncharacterized protein n=1 Tax=Mesonia oceanica TaxID=2687242 RepID=A0AC61YAF7_9FLAO|nr:MULTISPECIES: hypothetical protein [Mesonia]MAN27468.1 hypothetical protein [Mesonia sp.]MBJ96885.1 hypothetical protein [Flavobacteriaceae bacterium]VVV01497.1 hypothetical protein FVB9532_02789 [Mesonia oceanica]|tara:strand:- start:285 stop:956 length:672 start_codon:yes stop_codon:yes gene_type:complete
MKKIILLMLLSILMSCSVDDNLDSVSDSNEMNESQENVQEDLNLKNERNYTANNSFTLSNCLTGELDLDIFLNSEVEKSEFGDDLLGIISTTYSFTYDGVRPFTDDNFDNSCDSYSLRLEIAKGDIDPSTGEPHGIPRCYVLRPVSEAYPLVYYNLSFFGSSRKSFDVYTKGSWNCFYYRFILEGEECGYIFYKENPFDPDNPIMYDNTFDCNAFSDWIYYQS